MSALDELAPDQRAVLQMVLQRGRTYDEIAGLLSIDRAAVRRRALDACDALAPATVLPGPERPLVTDYLLGQLPEKVAEQVYAYLQASEADRAWAEAIAAAIGPLASGSLPEIPVGAPLGADDRSAGGPEPGSDPPARASEEPAQTYEEPAQTYQAPAQTDRAPTGTFAAAPREARPSSRRGGAILLGSVGALIVAVVLVVVLTGGGGKKHARVTAPVTPVTHTTTQTSATSATTTSSTAATTTVPAQILAQLNLTSPTGATSTVGVVQVVREGGAVGIIIAAQGLPANTAHNAYAVWLYNSPTSYRIVGFVQYLVGKNGKIDTEGRLKPGAAAYHKLLITLETQTKPKAPGEVVLSGPFREHS